MDEAKIISELKYKAVRSSGPGGQHVNKVASKVWAIFDLDNSEGLSDEEKIRIRQRLGKLLNKEGQLLLAADGFRSQHQNKSQATQRLVTLVRKALQNPKKRRPTKRTKASIEKRLASKKKDAQKKAFRKRPDY